MQYGYLDKVVVRARVIPTIRKLTACFATTNVMCPRKIVA
jgi:hypothetical protein